MQRYSLSSGPSKSSCLPLKHPAGCLEQVSLTNLDGSLLSCPQYLQKYFAIVVSPFVVLYILPSQAKKKARDIFGPSKVLANLEETQRARAQTQGHVLQCAASSKKRLQVFRQNGC
jgi:hypothetical protein